MLDMVCARYYPSRIAVAELEGEKILRTCKSVELAVPGLQLVIKLLMQARGKLILQIFCADGLVIPLID